MTTTLKPGDTRHYYHAMLDRSFKVRVARVTKSHVVVRIEDGQCKLTDPIKRVRSFTHRQAEALLA